MRTTCLALSLVALLVFSSSAQAGPVFDAAADFSGASNPNGAWSYGHASTLGGAMTQYTIAASFAGNPDISGWLGLLPGHLAGEPVVVKNMTGAVQTAGGMRLSPGQLALHPGGLGQLSVVRWTAPAAGDYSVKAVFDSADWIRGATTDVHVLHNGAAIFNGVVSGGFGPGTGPTFMDTISLGAGDTIEFVVGFGNGSFFNDSTALAAQIMGRDDGGAGGAPEPAALLLLAVGGLMVRRRKS